MGTMDDAAWTIGDLGSVDPEGDLGAQPLAESSPAAAAAAASAAHVDVVSALNQEDTRERPKQAQL